MKYFQLRTGYRPFQDVKMGQNVENISLEKINQSVHLRLGWTWKDKKKNTREAATGIIKTIDAIDHESSN